MINVEIDQEQLLKDLQAMEEGLQGKAIRQALTPAIKPIRDAMKTLAPEDEGALKKAIGVRTLSARAKSRLNINTSTVAVIVGPLKKVDDTYGGETKKRNQGYKGIWLEFGTKRAKAYPFMGPAIDQGEDGMQTRFFQGLQKALNKING